MKIYETLARGNFPKTYTGKILLVSFIGVHVPMFGAVAYVLLADTKPFLEQLDVLSAMLLATLIGTGGTMFVMKELYETDKFRGCRQNTPIQRGC